MAFSFDLDFGDNVSLLDLKNTFPTILVFQLSPRVTEKTETNQNLPSCINTGIDDWWIHINSSFNCTIGKITVLKFDEKPLSFEH